jgi:hypothetical protein|tara:strand:+ start:837 stop:1067 length:231 start_codon:yes stop_codon:yes gene_type:complete
MNKYTEADVNRTHQGIVEQLIDMCIQNWKNCTTPLHSRMWYAVAAKLEGIKEADYSMYDMERILAQANMNAQEQAQ